MPKVKKINFPAKAGSRKILNIVCREKVWAVVIAMLLFCPLFLYALPEGENVIEGNATFDRTEANTLKINVASEKAIIDYSNFSIAANESVYFSQLSVSSAALNRVTGSSVSDISGLLSANGIIYLINPNGINIGPTANIDAAGIIASTLNISNVDFLAGSNKFFKDGENTFIINQGNILVRNGGYVALLSQAVENQGVIQANVGTVVMASGEKMTLALDDLNQISVVIDEGVKEAVFGPDGKRIDSAVKNSGTITANGGKVILTAKVLNNVFDYAVNNTGIVEAKSLEGHNGVIELKGEGAPIINTGTLDANVVKVDAIDTDFINKGKVIAPKEPTIETSGIVNIQVNTLLQGGSIVADKLISVTADNINVFITGNPLAIDVDPLTNTSPAVIMQAPEVKVIARQFGSNDAPVNINASLTYINRTEGDINILESLGIGTSILLRGPPDGFGAIVYNRDTNLTLKSAANIIISDASPLSANTFSLIANQNISISSDISTFGDINILTQEGIIDIRGTDVVIVSQAGSVNAELVKGDINVYGTISAPNGVVRLWTDCSSWKNNLVDLRGAVIISKDGNYIIANPEGQTSVSWNAGDGTWETTANWTGLVSGDLYPNQNYYDVTVTKSDANIIVTTSNVITIGKLNIYGGGTTGTATLTLGAGLTIDNADGWSGAGDLVIGTRGTINAGNNNITVDNILTLDGGTLSTGSGIIEANTFTHVNFSTFNGGSGAVNITGGFTLSSGTFNNSTGGLTVGGILTLNGGTLAQGSGNVTAGTLTQSSSTATFTGGAGSLIVTNTLGLMDGTFTQPSGSMTVGGYDQSGGTFNGGSTNISVNGDFTISGGTFNSTSGTLYVAGNWSNSGTGAFSAGTSTVDFTKAVGTQTLTSGGTVAIKRFYNLNHSGAGTLQITTNNVYVNGNLNISNGILDPNGQIITGNGAANTLTIGNGTNATTILVPTLNFMGSYNDFETIQSNSASTVDYNRNANQNIVNSFSYYNLTISGSGTKTAGGALIVNGNLTVSTGATLDPNGNTITGNGTNTLDVTGTIEADRANFLDTYIGFGAINLNPGSTVDYSGTAQTIDHTRTYSNLSISGSGTKTLGGEIIVNGDLTINGGTTLDVSESNYGITIGGGWTDTTSGSFTYRTGTVTFNGTGDINSNQDIDFYNITIDTAGTVTLAGATTINGGLTVTAGSTLSINSALSVVGQTDVGGTLSITSGTTKKTFGDLTINNGGAFTITTGAPIDVNGNLQIDGTGSISVANGNWTLNGNLTVNDTGSITTGTGSEWTFQKVGGGTISGTVSSLSIAKVKFAANYTNSLVLITDVLTVNNGLALTNNGTVTVSTTISGTTGTLIQGIGATFNIGDSVVPSGFTINAVATGNTVDYNRVGNQTIKATTYHHLTLSGSGIKTLTIPIAINGNFTLSGTSGTVTATTVADLTIGGNLVIGDGTTFTAAGFALTVTGTTTVGGGTSGNLTINNATGTKIFTGLVTVNANGTWNNSGNSAITFKGGVTNNGTFTAGSGVYTFDTNAQAISGTLSIPSITVDTITLTNNDTLTITTALSGTGGLTNSATGTLNLNFGGAVGITTLTATAAGNTVNYGYAGNQSIKENTYDNLTISGSGTKTLGGAITVNGDLTVFSGILDPGTNVITGNATGTLTVSTGATIRIFTDGEQYWWDGPTVFESDSTVEYNGGDQPIDEDIPYENLTLSGSGTKSLVGATTVNGTLTVSSGTILDPSTFTINGSGANTLSVTGTIKVNAATFAGNYNNFAAPTLNAGSTVNYSGADQTVYNITYQNLTTSSSGTKTLADNTTVNGNLTVNTGTTLATATYTLGVGGNFTVNGDLTGSGAVSLSGSGTSIDGSGTIANPVTITNAKTIPSFADLTFNGAVTLSGGAADVTNNGIVTINADLIGTAGTAAWINAANSTLNAGGAVLSPGTLDATANPNTVNYNGADQTIKGVTYHHITLSGTGTKTLASGFGPVNGNLTLSGTASTTTVGALVIYGNLDVGSGTNFTVAGYNITVTGTTSVTGTLTHSSTAGTAKIYIGLVTINNGGIWNNSVGEAITLRGGLTNNGTFTAGSGIYTFDINTQAIAGTVNIPSITVNGITLTNNGTLTVSTALAGTGGLTNGATGMLNINFGGVVGITALTATAAGNTINYGFAGDQTIKATNYYNLTLSTSGTKTFASGTTGIANTLNITGTAIGNTTTNSATIDYNGSGAQTILAISALTYNNLTLSGGGTKTLGSAITINGNLNITSGVTLDINDANDYAITIGGNWLNSGTFNAYQGTVTFDGTGTITSGAGNSFNNLTISGDYTQSGDLNIEGDYTQTAGSFDSDPVNLFSVAKSFSISGGTFTRYDGTGSSEDPYIIYDVYGLQAIKCDLGAFYRLGIDFSATQTQNWNWDGTEYAGFEPLGTSGNPFSGTFNGNNRIVTGLYINRPSSGYVGLFGYISSGGQVSNIGLADGSVTGNYETGFLAGWNEGTITNSYSTGVVAAGDPTYSYDMGGLVGYNYNGTISDSYARGDVSGNSCIGGLAGENDGTITNSYATGNVTGTGDYSYYIGGLVGYNGWNSIGEITNSYATGNVSGYSEVGGLVGENYTSISNSYYSTGTVSGDASFSDSYEIGGLVGANYGTIDNSYSTGTVVGNSSDSYEIGGLVGYNSYGSIYNSYSTGTVSGYDYVGGLVGYNEYASISECGWWTGAATDAIGYESDYGPINRLSNEGYGYDEDLVSAFYNPVHPVYDGWDFPDTWYAYSDTYPHLYFEDYGTPITIYKWLGVTDDWADPANWSTNSSTGDLPEPGSVVIIDTNASNIAVLYDISPTIGSIRIDQGLALDANGNSITVSGNWVNLGDFYASLGTVIFNGTGEQYIISGGSAFYDLENSNSSITTLLLKDTLNISGSLTIDSNSTLDTQGNDIYISGDWVNNGTFKAGLGTVTFDGTVVQNIGGSSATTFNNLTIDNDNGVTLDISPTIDGSLTLANGKFNVTVTADASQAKVYGNADPALTYTNTPLIATDEFTGSLSRAAGNNVGSYAITQGDLSAGDNYTINFVSNDFNIMARPITVTAATDTKTYDGNTNSSVTPTITSGSLAGTDTATWTQSFDTKNTGSGKTLTPTGTISDGNSGNNYNVTFVNDTTGVINAKGLTVTGITANNKTYDGTTTATLNTASATLSGVVIGDTVTLNTTAAKGTFADSNVGNAKTVAISGLTISGASVANYSLTQPTTTANITAATSTDPKIDSQISNAIIGTSVLPDLGQPGFSQINTFNPGPVFLYTPLTPGMGAAFGGISGAGIPLPGGGLPLPGPGIGGGAGAGTSGGGTGGSSSTSSQEQDTVE